MSDDEGHHDDVGEAQRAMEEAQRKKAEKAAQEIAEFEELRKEEREKEERELEELRKKREQRKLERIEEEKRLAERRAAEDARKKAEEEERRRKKLEEENRIKEERERKRKEAEERMKNARTPNFVIKKKSGGSDSSEVSKEDLQKSKEQEAEEKKAILAQRIHALAVDGFKSDQLLEKARELHEHLRRLEGDKYDLEQRFKRQQYDMIELAERARQMNKGKSRSTASAKVDESFDRLTDKFTNAPPKILLCSKYERHTDHRSYGERKQLFEDICTPKPPPEIMRIKKGGDEEEAGGEEEGDE